MVRINLMENKKRRRCFNKEAPGYLRQLASFKGIRGDDAGTRLAFMSDGENFEATEHHTFLSYSLLDELTDVLPTVDSFDEFEEQVLM